MKKIGHALSLAVGLGLTGCGPAQPPATSSPTAPPKTIPDRTPVRRALSNIQGYLGDLEGRLKLSQAETWSHEASAAQHALGNLRIELGALREGAENVGKLESLLSDLEGSLRGASAENWNQNASAARQTVGSIRIELERLTRGMQDGRRIESEATPR